MVYQLLHPRIDGRVKLKFGQVSKITGNAVVMDDGTEMEGSCSICGNQPTSPTWIHGGKLHQSRHYTSIRALQLKARMEGRETPVYELQPSHHTR